MVDLLRFAVWHVQQARVPSVIEDFSERWVHHHGIGFEVLRAPRRVQRVVAAHLETKRLEVGGSAGVELVREGVPGRRVDQQGSVAGGRLEYIALLGNPGEKRDQMRQR